MSFCTAAASSDMHALVTQRSTYVVRMEVVVSPSRLTRSGVASTFQGAKSASTRIESESTRFRSRVTSTSAVTVSPKSTLRGERSVRAWIPGSSAVGLDSPSLPRSQARSATARVLTPATAARATSSCARFRLTSLCVPRRKLRRASRPPRTLRVPSSSVGACSVLSGESRLKLRWGALRSENPPRSAQVRPGEERGENLARVRRGDENRVDVDSPECLEQVPRPLLVRHPPGCCFVRP